MTYVSALRSVKNVGFKSFDFGKLQGFFTCFLIEQLFDEIETS